MTYKIWVLEREGYMPSRVKVTAIARHRLPKELGTIKIGDRFQVSHRNRRGNINVMTLTVTGFTGSGEYAYVDRDTSRRKQPIRTERLLKSPYKRATQ